jgi:hypothetical protein
MLRDSKVVMRTFGQLQAMDAAWHQAANSMQRLACARNQVERDQALDMFAAARDAYQAAKEGHVDEPSEVTSVFVPSGTAIELPDVPGTIIAIDGWDADGRPV